MAKTVRPIGLCQFLSPEQQQEWLDGKADSTDTAQCSEILEYRFKYAARETSKCWRFSSSMFRRRSCATGRVSAN